MAAKKSAGIVPQVAVKGKKGEKLVDRFYKGYDVKWLKEIGEEHPDFGLVAEFEKANGEIL